MNILTEKKTIGTTSICVLVCIKCISTFLFHQKEGSCFKRKKSGLRVFWS